MLGHLEHACANLDQLLIREVLSEAIGGFVSKEAVSDPMLYIATAAEPQIEELENKILPLFRK